jgi:Holliday junction resolvase
MKNCKEAGNRREREVRQALESYGWTVRKARASLGAADLVAIRGKRKLLIQVKAVKGSAYKTFGPEDRAELIREGEFCGGTPVLVHWPPYKPCRWFWVRHWPN